jgi:uncharacterized peroxidase-related enzyme
VPHIRIDNDLPGIGGLVRQRPDTGSLINTMAEALLRGPMSLTPGERELIAAYTSERNETPFCAGSHSAFAAAQLEGGKELVQAVLIDPETAPLTPRIRSLIRIAAEVQEPVHVLADETVAAARAAGADDAQIHDTVLVASAFCMINRYVTCLGTDLPESPAYYEEAAKRVIGEGYVATLT